MQGLQGLRVVPVVKVSPVAFEFFHGAHRIRRALSEFSGRDVAKVVGRKIGQQRHADVGRRSTVRDRANTVFLIVVGRQPIVFGANVSVEKRPDTTRQGTQEKQLFVAQAGLAAHQRATDPPSNDRRDKPQQQNRSRDN